MRLPPAPKKTVDRGSIAPILSSIENTMTVSSTKSQSDVNTKPPTFSALPGSGDTQLKIAMADIRAKAAEMQELQKSGLGAPAPSGLKLDILIRGDKGGRRGICNQAEQLRGIFIACQGKGSQCWPSERLQSDWMGLSERQVRRLRHVLKDDELLTCHWQDRHRVYTVVTDIVTEDFWWVGINWVSNLKLRIVVVQLLAYIRWRRFDEGAACFKNREAAEALGVSVDTIRRARAVLVAQGFLQVSKRPGRGSRGNIYRLTLWAEWKIGVFEPEKKVAKCPTKLNYPKEGDYSYANSVRNGSLRAILGLSFDPALDQKSFVYLDKLRTHRSVAKLAVVDWRHDPESVRNSFINTICEWEKQRRNARKLGLPPPGFNPAGYNLATLNNAKAEGHGIPLSKLAKTLMATDQGKAVIAAAGRLTEAEDEQRKKELKKQLRTTPAKHTTPGKEAESVIIQQNSDKEAKVKHLAAVQAAARSRSHSYQKHANLGHKLHISTKLDRQVGISAKFPARSPPRPPVMF